MNRIPGLTVILEATDFRRFSKDSVYRFRVILKLGRPDLPWHREALALFRMIMASQSGKIRPTDDPYRIFCFPQMQRLALNLKFKGGRNYVHGSDIYNGIDRIARDIDGEACLSMLTFRHFGRQDCDLSWLAPAGDETLVAQGKISLPDGSRQFWIIESRRPVTERYEFDEDSLVSTATISKDTIVLHGRTAYTPIEEIIALTKRLNYELDPNVDGKWVFGQLKQNRAFPLDYSSLMISRSSEVPGRFSVNNIFIDEQPIGDIRFIVGKP